MARSTSPRRYAQAAFQIALERDDMDAWLEDLAFVATALDDRQLLELLDAPQVPAARKLDVIVKTFDDSVAPLVVNLVSLLAQRGLVHLVPGILDEYGRFVDARRGIERVEVTAAVPLDTDQQARITELLRGIVGKDVRLSVVEDSQILGGLVARFSDRVIDGSLKTKLRELRREMVEQVS